MDLALKTKYVGFSLFFSFFFLICAKNSLWWFTTENLFGFIFVSLEVNIWVQRVPSHSYYYHFYNREQHGRQILSQLVNVKWVAFGMHIFSHKLKCRNSYKVFQLEDIYCVSTWKQQGIPVKNFFTVSIWVVSQIQFLNNLLFFKIFILSFMM